MPDTIFFKNLQSINKKDVGNVWRLLESEYFNFKKDGMHGKKN